MIDSQCPTHGHEALPPAPVPELPHFDFTASELPPTAEDLRVLRHVPSGTVDSLTTWQIAERIDTIRMPDLIATLSSLERRNYVVSARSRSRKRTVFRRTSKGDEAVAG